MQHIVTGEAILFKNRWANAALLKNVKLAA